MWFAAMQLQVDQKQFYLGTLVFFTFSYGFDCRCPYALECLHYGRTTTGLVPGAVWVCACVPLLPAVYVVCPESIM
jgi:hypothetical protein